MPVAASVFSLAYGTASFGFLFLATLTLLRPIRTRLGRVFVVAAIGSGCVFFVAALSPWFTWLGEFRVFDALPIALWTGFVLFACQQITSRSTRITLWAVLALSTFVEIAIHLTPSIVSVPWRYLSRLVIALLAIVAAEQLIRNVPDQGRWALKHLVLAIIAAGSFELAIFAYGMATGAIDHMLWVTRGFIWAFGCPLLALSAVRNPSWDVSIHVSRTVIFQSFSILVVGFLLVVLGLMGYVVSDLGVGWGRVIQSSLLGLGVMALATIAMSQTVRSKIRGFVDKNFYSYRFDYRQEWLRFTSALAFRQGESVYKAVADAFQQLCDSPGSCVYAINGDILELRYAFGLSVPSRISLAGITKTTVTPHDLHESDGVGLEWQHREFGRTEGAESIRFTIPLLERNKLIGLVGVANSRGSLILDREVDDLLQVAAQQASGFVQQYLATEELLVTKQFDSFNKMSAFVVHDLKNLAAQLALMSANAEQHRGNPEFQADMLETVSHVTTRMRALLAQLTTGGNEAPPTVVEINDCISLALASKPGLRTHPTFEAAPKSSARVLAHEDRLSRIVGHIIQNADEAIGSRAGSIDVRVSNHFDRVEIAISDTGLGMSDAFIREKLFRPFTTTKSTGMGIGMFESANYIREIGGELQVESTLGIGSTFKIVLPIVEPPNQLRENE